MSFSIILILGTLIDQSMQCSDSLKLNEARLVSITSELGLSSDSKRVLTNQDLTLFELEEGLLLFIQNQKVIALRSPHKHDKDRWQRTDIRNREDFKRLLRAHKNFSRLRWATKFIGHLARPQSGCQKTIESLMLRSDEWVDDLPGLHDSISHCFDIDSTKVWTLPSPFSSDRKAWNFLRFILLPTSMIWLSTQRDYASFSSHFWMNTQVATAPKIMALAFEPTSQSYQQDPHWPVYLETLYRFGLIRDFSNLSTKEALRIHLNFEQFRRTLKKPESLIFIEREDCDPQTTLAFLREALGPWAKDLKIEQANLYPLRAAMQEWLGLNFLTP